MKFISTRNNTKEVEFSQAILNCLPNDGGLYAPAYAENLSPWIRYMDKDSTFVSIAGSLTQALMKEEFSPIISEAIVSNAFHFSPNLEKLDDNLYVLELFHGPTGTHKDFGLSYLTSCLEYVNIMEERDSIIIASTDGETGSAITNAIRGKRSLKAILLFEKGTMRGFSEEDCIWNGGNIYPVEVNGTREECDQLTREIYSNPELIEKYRLTLANTANIGRLLPHTFIYMYAFSRLKNTVNDNIYYAMQAGNYGNIMAGLYAWKFSLPLSGIITNCTCSLTRDAVGKCSVSDSLVPLTERSAADPVEPSNIERLEELFTTSPAVMKALVFPQDVSDDEAIEAGQELFVKYGKMYDLETARSYCASKKRGALDSDDGSAVILVAYRHPSLPTSCVKMCCGEAPEMSEELQKVYSPVKPEKTIDATKENIIRILEKLHTF